MMAASYIPFSFAGSVCLLILLTVRWRVPAFLALLVTSYFAGICFGMPFQKILSLISEGFGSTLGDIGLTIAIGALLGSMMESCGATTIIANGIIRSLGGKFPGIAMALTGYIVSIPIYCDSGFIILDSVRKNFAKKHNVSPIFLSTILGCALYATHTLVPPTPGPLAAIVNFKLVDQIAFILPLSLLFSLLAVFASFCWAEVFRHKVIKLAVKDAPASIPQHSFSFALAMLPIVIPMALITTGGLSSHFSGPEWVTFVGHPVTALLIGLLSCVPLVLASNVRESINTHLQKGLETGGRIVLVVGCGGAFSYILRHSGLADRVTDIPGVMQLGLFFPFLIAALIKTAEGSATVALITASSIVEPLLHSLGLDSTTGRFLALFSCGAGAMAVAHVNDSFFWVIAEFTGMDTATALKSITVATFIQGVTLFAFVQLAGLWVL
ncbi:GntP family permease [Endozoicomonas sp.]|nr:GntP family permease [Endozoicomonas sp.]